MYTHPCVCVCAYASLPPCPVYVVQLVLSHDVIIKYINKKICYLYVLPLFNSILLSVTPNLVSRGGDMYTIPIPLYGDDHVYSLICSHTYMVPTSTCLKHVPIWFTHVSYQLMLFGVTYLFKPHIYIYVTNIQMNGSREVCRCIYCFYVWNTSPTWILHGKHLISGDIVRYWHYVHRQTCQHHKFLSFLGLWHRRL